MPITAERLSVDVEANTSKAKRDLGQFDSGVKKVTGSTNRAGRAGTGMGKKFSAAGALVKATAGTMIAAMAGKTIMSASDLNEVLSKTGTVFGPQAKIVTDAAQEMADKFGMSKATFLDAASGIGLVGKASGLTKKAAAGLSVDMSKLAADASSFYDVPVEEALAAMKSGLVGEAEPMRRFGVLLNEAAVKNEALRLGIAKTGDELTEGQKVQARSSLIMNGMSDASGDLEKTQESVANRLREIRGRVTNFAADMGTKALPAVEKFLTVLIEGPGKIKAFQKSIDGWIKSHPILTKVLQAVAILVTAVFIPAMVAAGVVAVATKVKVVAGWVAQQVAAIKSTALQSVAIMKNIAFYIQYGAVVAAQSAKAAGAMILNAARTVGAWVLMGAQSMIQAARMAAAWVIAMGPVGWAIAAAVAVGVAIYKNWDKIVAATKAAWNAVSGAITKAWGKIKSGVMSGVNATIGFVKNNWKKIVAILTGPLGIAVGLIVSNWGTIKATFSSGVEKVKSLWTGAWNKVKSTTSSAIGKVVGWVKGIPGKVTGALSGAEDLLVNAGTAIIEGLWSGLKSKWEDVKDWFGSITDAIPNLKGPAAKDKKLLVKNGRLIMQGFKKGLDGEWSDTRKWLKDVTKWVQKAAFSDKAQKGLQARLKRVGERTRALMKKDAAQSRKLEQALQDKADKIQAKADFRTNVESGITAQANVLNSGNSAATIAASLRAQVTKVQEFASNLARMKALGFSGDVMTQVASAGVEGGAQVAQALAAATDAEVGSMNASFGAIQATAVDTAKTLAAQLHDAGIQSAEGVIQGIKDRRVQIKETLRTIADSMVDAIAKAVKQATGKNIAKAAKGTGDAAKGDTSKGNGGGKGNGGKGNGGKGPRGPKGGGNERGGATFHFTTNNPQAEPQSRTTNKALARAASLGLI